jgi:hypothetical protein
MPTRRSLLFGTAGLIAGSGAIFGTGAFTSVEADRTVTVQTAGDNSAALALETINDSPNSTGDDSYVTLSDGTLSIEIPNVNLEAVTHINRLFRITNNGTQDVVVYIEEVINNRNEGNDNGNAIDFNAKKDQFEGNPEAGGSHKIANPELVDISGPSGSPGDVGILLPTGESVEVGISIDTSDENLNNGLNSDQDAGVGSGTEVDADEYLLDSARIIAESTAAENGNYNYELSN